MKPDVELLCRDYLPGMLEPILHGNGVAQTVLVQASNSLEETLWLLELADENSFIAGDNEEAPRMLSPLAALPNVSCELSGLVTEANLINWRVEDLKPYVDTAFEYFGPERMIFGSDWPVCLLAATYERVLGAFHN